MKKDPRDGFEKAVNEVSRRIQGKSPRSAEDTPAKRRTNLAENAPYIAPTIGMRSAAPAKPARLSMWEKRMKDAGVDY